MPTPTLTTYSATDRSAPSGAKLTATRAIERSADTPEAGFAAPLFASRDVFRYAASKAAAQATTVSTRAVERPTASTSSSVSLLDQSTRSLASGGGSQTVISLGKFNQGFN